MRVEIVMSREPFAVSSTSLTINVGACGGESRRPHIEFTRLSNALSQRLRDNPLEVREIEWLVDIGESPELQGFTSKRGVYIPGDHDHSARWIDRTNSFEQFDTVRSGKCDVEQNQLGPGEDRELQTFVARQCTEDAVALLSEITAEDVHHVRVVVDYENPGGRGCQRHHERPSSSEMPLLPSCDGWLSLRFLLSAAAGPGIGLGRRLVPTRGLGRASHCGRP